MNFRIFGSPKVREKKWKCTLEIQLSTLFLIEYTSSFILKEDEKARCSYHSIYQMHKVCDISNNCFTLRDNGGHILLPDFIRADLVDIYLKFNFLWSDYSYCLKVIVSQKFFGAQVHFGSLDLFDPYLAGSWDWRVFIVLKKWEKFNW